MVHLADRHVAQVLALSTAVFTTSESIATVAPDGRPRNAFLASAKKSAHHLDSKVDVVGDGSYDYVCPPVVERIFVIGCYLLCRGRERWAGHGIEMRKSADK
jgi:hypothetical protein